ncbi:MAG: efflux RND transporter periplasmic adaptor subunit [Terriglobales bacterium]
MAAALAVGLGGCGGGSSEGPAPVVTVQAAAVAQGPIEQWVNGEAVLYPLHQAIITPKISAPVAAFYVQRGDHVRTGELVARLENKDLAAANQEAKARLEAAQADYATATAGAIPQAMRKAQLDAEAAQKALANAQSIDDSRKQLFQQGALPKRLLDQAGVDLTNAQNAYDLAQQALQADQAGGHQQALAAAKAALDAAQAQAEAAQAQFGYSEIRSPLDGVVTDRPLYPGELATPSAPLMTIMQLATVVARTHLPAAQAALLRAGDQARLTAPGASAPLPGQVTVVSPATDPSSTTVSVWVEAANPGDALRPGTTVEAAMLARTIPAALTIPASALLTDAAGATSVMVAGADGKAHEREVSAGLRVNGQIQILKGLKAGERVVSQGAYGLADGTKITIQAAPAADGA